MALALGILHIPSWTWHCNCIACISRFRSSKFTASKSPGALNRTLAADAGSPLIRQIISNIYIICHYLTNSTKPCGSNWHMTHLLWERSSEGMQFASPQRLEVWPATRSSLVQGVAHPCYVYFPHLDPCDSMCLTGRYWKQFDLGNWHMLHMLLCFSLECLGGCLCLLASFGIFWHLLAEANVLEPSFWQSSWMSGAVQYGDWSTESPCPSSPIVKTRGWLRHGVPQSTPHDAKSTL